jgi:hypothetical protein
MDERIRPAFFADRRRRAVPGQNSDQIPERKNFLSNALEEQLAITSGQIPSPHSAGKKHVAPNQYVVRSR